MDNLKIKATKHTPSINFDTEKNILVLKGECYPENISEFSTPIFSWLTDYLKQLTNEVVIVNLEISYFNSSTSRMLLEFFLKLEDGVVKNGNNITVNWLYDEDNDSAEEFGEEFEEDLDSLPFNLVVKED